MNRADQLRVPPVQFTRPTNRWATSVKCLVRAGLFDPLQQAGAQQRRQREKGAHRPAPCEPARRGGFGEAELSGCPRGGTLRRGAFFVFFGKAPNNPLNRFPVGTYTNALAEYAVLVAR